MYDNAVYAVSACKFRAFPTKRQRKMEQFRDINADCGQGTGRGEVHFHAYRTRCDIAFRSIELPYNDADNGRKSVLSPANRADFLWNFAYSQLG